MGDARMSAGRVSPRVCGSPMSLGGRGRASASAECGPYSVEAGRDLSRPLPGLVDAEAKLACAVGQACGDVQYTVTESGHLASGQGGLVGEADQFGPGDQVDGGEHGLEPGGVLVPAATRKVAQTGGLGFADPVLDAGVLAVPQLEPGCLTGDQPV